METPRTLQEAIIFFSDAERAFQYALRLRFPNGKISCPRCGSDKHSFVKTRRLWHCKGCKKQFSLKVGTIFEDSPLGLDKWMMAMWLLSACKNGISSYELSRSIGVTQRSAWFMLHRLREVMRAEHNPDFPMGNSPANQVEIDETYIGGKRRICTLPVASSVSRKTTRLSSWECVAARPARSAQGNSERQA